MSEGAHRFLIVGDEEERSAVGDQFFDLLKTSLLKKGIADREGFIDDQNIRLDLHLHGERQAHEHAAGIAFDRLIDELIDVGEGRDRLEPVVDFFPGQAEQRAVQIDVFPSGEFGIEPGTEFQQRRSPAVDFDVAAGRLEGAGDQLQQRAFAAAVAADDSDCFALFALRTTHLSAPRIPGKSCASRRRASA